MTTGCQDCRSSLLELIAGIWGPPVIAGLVASLAGFWWHMRRGKPGWEPIGWVARPGVAAKAAAGVYGRAVLGLTLGLVPGLGHLVVGPRRIGVLIFVGVLVLAGISKDALALLIPLIVVLSAVHLLWRATVYGMPPVEGKMLELAAAAEAGGPSCPRCRAADRTATGWCEDCATALAAVPVSIDATEVRVTVWTDRYADRELRAWAAGQQVVASSSGSIIRLGWMMGRTTAWNERLAYPTCTTTIEAAYRDPDVPGVLWTRSTMLRISRDGLAREWQAVGAHRFRDGRLDHSWEFQPISHATWRAAAETAERKTLVPTG